MCGDLWSVVNCNVATSNPGASSPSSYFYFRGMLPGFFFIYRCKRYKRGLVKTYNELVFFHREPIYLIGVWQKGKGQKGKGVPPITGLPCFRKLSKSSKPSDRPGSSFFPKKTKTAIAHTAWGVSSIRENTLLFCPYLTWRSELLQSVPQCLSQLRRALPRSKPLFIKNPMYTRTSTGRNVFMQVEKISALRP